MSESHPPPGGSYPPPPPPGGSYPPPPPGAAYPPPGGTGFPHWRTIVRPRQGRYVAGVGAALGRATGTDPVLWRVLLVVLSFFGGVGVLLYLTGWLVLPEEGDTASPVEAALGKGRSHTSPATVVLLAVLAAIAFGTVVSDSFPAVMLGAALIGGAALLIRRNSVAGPAAAASPEAAAGPAAGPAAGAAPGPDAATADPSRVADPSPVADPATAATPPPGPTATPHTAAATTPPAWSPPAGGYRPPFAPHGPYAGPPGPPPPFAAPPPPKPPKPPKERSALGRVTFSAMLVVLGVLAVLDLSGAVAVSAPAYFAAALLTIALGLILGAWMGRARGLIALGLIAALGLAATNAAADWDGQHPSDVHWQPQTIAELNERYAHTAGKATLDLSGVDFTDRTASTTVRLDVGELLVFVGPNVDVVAAVDQDLGSMRVFGQHWAGVDSGPREITDNGADGPGGGNLRLILSVNVGNLEVTR